MSNRNEFSQYFDTNKRPFIDRGCPGIDYCGYCDSPTDGFGRCNCDGFGNDPRDGNLCRCGGTFIDDICNECRAVIGFNKGDDVSSIK
jgi:hypothetical protein